MSDGVARNRPPPEEDHSGAVEARLGGCLIALVLFVVLVSLPSILEVALPDLLWYLAATLTGLALLSLYRQVVRRRWDAEPPDVVQLVGHDLYAVLDRSLLDYRLVFDRAAWPWRERLLHELLYGLKWLGHFLIITGLGSLVYGALVRLGVVVS